MSTKEKVVDFCKRNKATIYAVLLIAAAYVIFGVVGMGCPIKFVSGISCLGCGMTRAVGSVLKLDFAKSFYYHPLWVLLPVWVVIYFLRKKINIKVIKVLFGLTMAAFVVVYFIRMFDPHNHVVVCDPQNSAVFRLYRLLT